MKALFKLKQEPIVRDTLLPRELAEEYYRKGGLPFEINSTRNSRAEVRISYGFFSKKLSFGEWLARYSIRVL